MKKLIITLGILLVALTTKPQSLDVGTNPQEYDVSPVPGDNYKNLQHGIDYCINHNIPKLYLYAGTYSISHPLIVRKISGGTYAQVTIDIEGPYAAMDAPGYMEARIIPTFTNGFAIGIQQGKGCTIKNLFIQGKYKLPTSLTPLQIDTLSWAQWSDGLCSNNRTSPYAGIVIDPFSDPSFYDGINTKKYQGLDSFYRPKMPQSGSTSIIITGCSILNFVVGVMITPSMQYNGEMISFNDGQISACLSDYAYGSAQNKTNSINNLMSWGQSRTIIDGIHFGFVHTDAATAPIVHVMNIAGSNYEIICTDNRAFPISMYDVWAEGIFKIGYMGTPGGANVLCEGWKIDFQNASNGYPTPGYYYHGGSVDFVSCMLRMYNGGSGPTRMILNDRGTTFWGGSLGGYPVTFTGQGNDLGPCFNRVNMFYSSGIVDSTQGSLEETIAPLSTSLVRINRSNFTGYFVSTDTYQLRPNDILLVTMIDEDEGTNPYLPVRTNYQYPLGYITSVSNDTVYLRNTGLNIHDSTTYSIFVDRAL